MVELRKPVVPGAREVVRLPEGVTVFKFADDQPWNAMLDVAFQESYPLRGCDFTQNVKNNRVLDYFYYYNF